MENERQWQPKPFCLPFTATFGVRTDESGRTVAHALDFDIVAVGESPEAALEKLRLSVKVYIEYGLANNLAECIHFRAPDKYWNAMDDKPEIGLLDPIQIEDNRMFVLRATATAPLNDAPGRLNHLAYQ